MSIASRLLKLALCSALLAVALSAPRLQAQGHGGPGGPGRGPGEGPGEMGGGAGRGGALGDAFRRENELNTSRNLPAAARDAGGNVGVSRGGLQLGPPGRWWDDSQYARTVGLDRRQQKRMDDVFSANKGELLKLYKNLQQEELALEKTTRAKQLDEGQIFAQIDRVTQARGELEKANAHMLLEIRKEMTAEQTARLDESRPSL